MGRTVAGVTDFPPSRGTSDPNCSAPPLGLIRCDDPYALPERHVARDLSRRGLRVRVVPGRRLQSLALDLNVIVLLATPFQWQTLR